MSETTFSYSGRELALFAEARNWKRYVACLLSPHISGTVVEVGAGIGTNTCYLTAISRFKSWTCLEPDGMQARAIEEKISTGELPPSCSVCYGVLGDIVDGTKFDTILYIDVLEHIRDDHAEFDRAASHLTDGGRLIILCPAHNWLFSPFDASIGHYRRYSRRSFCALGNPRLRLSTIRYVDSLGLLASLANRLILRAAMPTEGQIRFWDRTLVPASRVIDNLLIGNVGKSIIGIWEGIAIRE